MSIMKQAQDISKGPTFDWAGYAKEGMTEMQPMGYRTRQEPGARDAERSFMEASARVTRADPVVIGMPYALIVEGRNPEGEWDARQIDVPSRSVEKAEAIAAEVNRSGVAVVEGKIAADEDRLSFDPVAIRTGGMSLRGDDLERHSIRDRLAGLTRAVGRGSELPTEAQFFAAKQAAATDR